MSLLARVLPPAIEGSRWRRLRRIVDYFRRSPAAPIAADPFAPLTVGALIEQLGRFDRDMPVVMPGEVEDWSGVFEAHLDIFSPQRGCPELLELADDGDDDAVLMVRLFGDPDR